MSRVLKDYMEPKDHHRGSTSFAACVGLGFGFWA